MNLRLFPYRCSDRFTWDTFCNEANQATFLHTRKFLRYHGNRFKDKSLIIRKDEEVIALFPGAIDPLNTDRLVSHPGSTFGGLLQKNRLPVEETINILEKILQHYADEGFKTLIYKSVPYIYHRVPAQQDIYALFRLNAKLVRSDLSTAINLKFLQQRSHRRNRALKKAISSGALLSSSSDHLDEFWPLLEANLMNRYGKSPTHSLGEMKLLFRSLPDHVECVCGQIDGEIVAGTILFKHHMTTHTQYMATNELGRKTSALDLLLNHCIKKAVSEDKHWFDFGISTENEGQLINEGLSKFKTEFGGGGVVHDFYEIELN